MSLYASVVIKVVLGTQVSTYKSPRKSLANKLLLSNNAIKCESLCIQRAIFIYGFNYIILYANATYAFIILLISIYSFSCFTLPRSILFFFFYQPLSDPINEILRIEIPQQQQESRRAYAERHGRLSCN